MEYCGISVQLARTSMVTDPTEQGGGHWHIAHVQVAETGGEVDDGTARFARYKYPAMSKTLGNFSLNVRVCGLSSVVIAFAP